MDRVEDLTAEEIVELIREAVAELKRRCRRRLGEDTQRYESTCLADVEIAIDHEHEWLGRAAVTLVELAEELDFAEEEDEEGDADQGAER